MRTTEARKIRELRYYFALVVRWSWFLGLCILLGGGGTYIVSKLQNPVYRATTLLIVDQKSSSDPYSNVLANNQLVTTYIGLINQPSVMERAASQVGGVSATSLAGRTQVAAQSGTQIIVLQVDDTDPVRAAVSANAVARAFIDVLAQQNVTSKDTVRIFQLATPPTSPDHPKPLYNSLLGAVLGLILALCFVILHAFLDDRIRTVDQFEWLPQVSMLGTFPLQKAGHGDGLLLSEESNSLPVDALRILRTNLHFVSTRPMRSIAIISSSLHEGKTTIAINLALSLVQNGKRVLLVDADLRHPTIHTRLGLPNTTGLSLALREHNYSGVFSTVPEMPDLVVLSAGPPPPDPTELLESPSMAELLHPMPALEAQVGKVDVIVIDTPLALKFADVPIIASLVDGVVLVTRAGVSRESSLLQTIAMLKRVNACILGVVLNGVKKSRQDVSLEKYYRQQNERHERFIATITTDRPSEQGSDVVNEASVDSDQPIEEQWSNPSSTWPETETGVLIEESAGLVSESAGRPHLDTSKQHVAPVRDDDTTLPEAEDNDLLDTQTVKVPRVRIRAANKD
ncbi:MAG: polysaccharide biosynthesis tyrosine autokinase [Ktedonobacteraceae bacterium]|nr:polysaccharide biosynthesis tyrosine autokinase [Ktedonobacteraceae bacterium]